MRVRVKPWLERHTAILTVRVFGPSVADPVALGERALQQDEVRVGLAQDSQQSQTAAGTAPGAEGRHTRTGTGYVYLHTALEDHSRLAHSEDLPDEIAATSATFPQRATAWFATRDITVERVLTDDTWAYSKNTWRQTCHELSISPGWIRPWLPRTDGLTLPPRPPLTSACSRRRRCCPREHVATELSMDINDAVAG
ncbi:Integrase catalytic domain-containing protein OS=Streptomyces griseorubiginosus OX=67304 GN=AQJ54_39345 PE=4 SV=1 [Streptomyces griseorubiginosus]